MKRRQRKASKPKASPPTTAAVTTTATVAPQTAKPSKPAQPVFRAGALSAPARVENETASDFPEVTHPKKRAFLVAYALSANVREAAAAAGVCEKTVWNWRFSQAFADPTFAAAMVVAQQMACDRVEAEIKRRAVDGYEKPVYQLGRLVGTERVYSDLLLIFLAKGLMPNKYREKIGIVGPDGGPIQIARAEAMKTLTDDELRILEAAATKLLPAKTED